MGQGSATEEIIAVVLFVCLLGVRVLAPILSKKLMKGDESNGNETKGDEACKEGR